MLAEALERLYEKYNRRCFIGSDPLQFVYDYSNPRDMEVAAVVSACLAYGRVAQIKGSLSTLFGMMGDSPFKFVMSFAPGQARKLSGFRHRFTSGPDLSEFFLTIRQVLARYGSLEHFFLVGYNSGQNDIAEALDRFTGTLLQIHAGRNNGHISPGVAYLLSRPSAGSACKRMNLFLRWMVRNDRVDPGLWKGVDKKKLIVPMDTHMTRLCRLLGLYSRKATSLAAAREVTMAFAKVAPQDPVRYDFALSRVGIVDNCNGQQHDRCEICGLAALCTGRRPAGIVIASGPQGSRPLAGRAIEQ